MLIPESSPGMETLAVSLFAALGALLGRWFSRRPGNWWLAGYLLPLLLLGVVLLPRIWRSLEFVPPMSWLVSGRTLFAISGLVITLILTTPLSRLPNRRDRMVLSFFIVFLVCYASVWPFLAPVFNHRYQASLTTRIDGDGICRQSTDYNCGPAAAVTALRQLGFPAEEGEIAILAHTSTAIGTPPDVLCRALRKRYGMEGLICEYRRFHSVSELNQGEITLAVTRFGLLVDHYVAVLQVSKDEIVVGDPFLGKKSYSTEAFARQWRFCGVTLKRKP